jgi:hypothetical protein
MFAFTRFARVFAVFEVISRLSFVLINWLLFSVSNCKPPH